MPRGKRRKPTNVKIALPLNDSTIDMLSRMNVVEEVPDDAVYIAFLEDGTIYFITDGIFGKETSGWPKIKSVATPYYHDFTVLH